MRKKYLKIVIQLAKWGPFTSEDEYYEREKEEKNLLEQLLERREINAETLLDFLKFLERKNLKITDFMK